MKQEQLNKSNKFINLTPQLIVGIIILIIVFLLFLTSLDKGDILSTRSTVFATLFIGIGFSVLHFNPTNKKK